MSGLERDSSIQGSAAGQGANSHGQSYEILAQLNAQANDADSLGANVGASQDVLLAAAAQRFGVLGCKLRHGLIDPLAVKLISQDEAHHLAAIPILKVHDTLTVAMADPKALATIDRLHQLTGCKIRPVLTIESDIRKFIDEYARDDVNVDTLMSGLEVPESVNPDDRAINAIDVIDLDQSDHSSPVVKLVNVMLLSAIREHASDIHIEPRKDGTKIRCRVDGMLRDLMSLPPGSHAAIVSRLKVIGGMDIAQNRMAQEGRIKIVTEGKEIDVRVSSLPTLRGEKLVLRILDKSALCFHLDGLGIRTEALTAIKRMLRCTHGLVLVTGPTGSGKTTTLYCALDMLCSPTRNVVTVENPVEYELDTVNQVQVNESIGMTFPRALRSILRQDPDVIMVGEIRDEQTARVAIQAALTGHLVLATLHTNDAPSAVTRLHDMGIECYLIANVLNGVIAQRLARTVCPNCSTKYRPDEHMLWEAGADDQAGRAFRKGMGCQQCYGSGFRGRKGIYEVMEMRSPLRKVVHRSSNADELRQEWRRMGGLTLREEAVLMAQEGKSSLEEVLRVTQSDDEIEQQSAEVV